MSENLGKIIGVYGLSPIFKQRAFIVATVSFAFFTTMVVGFLIRPGFVFVLLGTAFLVIALFTLLGWFAQRNTEFRLFENGFTYRKFVCAWNEIESLNVKTENSRIGAKTSFVILTINGREIILTETIADLESIIKLSNKKIQSKIAT